MKAIKSGIPSYYHPEQVRAYLQRIKFPGAAENEQPLANLANLELLVRLHLLAFPFENSRLHYTTNHDVDVSTEFVYRRLIETRQGGSWCFGQNGLLLGMLRGLGYRAYAAPARVNMSPPTSTEGGYSLLSHLVVMVQFDNESSDPLGQQPSDQTTYLVDVGFGGSGLTRPIRLEVGTVVPGSAPPEEHRIMRVMFPESSLEETESAREWSLQVRCGSYQPDWTIQFIFYEFEFYPGDFVAASQWLSRYPVALMRDSVIAIRHFAVDGTEDISGGTAFGRLVMAGNKVSRRIGDRSDTVKEFTTEQERVRILSADFGITVGEQEVSNIYGTPAALKVQ